MSNKDNERLKKTTIAFLKDFAEQGYENAVECIDWLKKQETIGEIVERCKNSWYNEGKIQGQIEGLSDEEKYQQGVHDALEKQSNNQNWKPSKEQINALEHFVRSIGESGYASPYDANTKILKSLIDDLYKLEKQREKPQGKSAFEAIKEEKVDNTNKIEPKKLDADEVIEWLDENVADFWKSPCNPQNVIDKFKEYFGL